MADSVKIKITGDDKEFQSTLSGIGKTAGSVFKGMLASQIVTKGISLLTGGLKSAINTGMQFEAAMSQVAAISGATGSELALLTETAKHYGETTKFTASQAAEALNYMALAGWDANQSVAALPGVLDLAAASGMDLGRASDAVTDYLSAFSMEASQAGYMADLMAYAQSKSNTSAQQLADAYGNCASSMHAAGQDIETTTAMLMALANQGIKGSEAGTQMSAVMRDLTQKMENGNILIGKTSVAVQDAQGNFRDLNDIIADVGKATEGMGSAEKSAAIMTTFTARSVKAIQTILNEGMGSVNAYEEALRGSEGTAAEQAKTMMDNLQGDVQVFQSALEGVQITASESTNGIARSIVQEGTAVLEAVNRAGKTGGIGGMFDAAIAQIPALLPKAVKGVEGLLSGLGKRLPGLVKNLFAAAPDILGSMADLVPNMTDSLTGVVIAAAEGAIANLPDVTLGLFKAASGLVDGLFNGIGGALKRHGLMALNLDDRIAEAFASADTAHIKVENVNVPNIAIDGKIDTEAYLDRVQAAKEAISKAVDGLKISDTDAEALKKALMQGSGADALKAALKVLNVPEADINTVVSNLSGFKAKMDAVFAEFDISDGDGSISQNIADYVAQGGTLEEALTMFAGLSAADAKTAAEKLQPDLDAAVAAINALNIAGLDTATIKQACIDAKGDIAAALKMLGADDEAIAAALASIDTLKDSVTTRLEAAFEEIKKAFTNGDATDDAEAANEALSAIGEAGEAAGGKIDSWLANYKQQLADMNVSATEYETAVKNAEEKAQAMHDELDATISAAQSWVAENAGAATEAVQSHIGELDGILSNLENLEARVETLKGALNTRDYATRSAVERGVLGSQNAQATAIALTAKEYELAVTKAAEDYAREEESAIDAIEAASKNFAEGLITADERAAKELEAQGILEQAESQRGNAERKAREAYNAHMDAIVQGMLAADPETSGVLNKIRESAALRRFGGSLWAAIGEAVRENGAGSTSADELLIGMGMGPDDMAALASAIGMSVDSLYTQVENALKSENPDAILADAGGLKGFVNGTEQAVADALEGVDLSDAAAVLQKSMDEGWLNAEWGDPQDALKQAMLDYANAPMEALEALPAEAPQTTIAPELTVEPELTPSGDIGEKVEAAMEAATDGAEGGETLQPEFSIEPEVTNAEQVRQALVSGIQSATQGMNLDDVLAGANLTRGDFSGLAEALGLEPGALENAINGALKGADPAAALTGVFAGVDLSALTVPVGTGISEGVTAGIESGAGAAASASESMGRQAAEAAGTGAAVHSPSAITVPVGQGIADGVTTGITSGTGAAVAAATALGHAASTAVRADIGSIQAAGRSMSAGLASGILAGRGAVVAAARAVAQAAASAMRSAMQIHSPSKVTEGFGRMFDRGLVVGIDAEAGSVVRSAVRMVNNAVGAANLSPKLDLSGVTASVNGAISNLADIEGSRDIALYVNGREMARATDRDYNAALNGYAKRVAMGYGRG